MVDVYDNKGNLLGVGHYQPGSIAVRILAFEKIEPDINFFRDRIRSAIEYRKAIGIFNNPVTNVFRLVHAEGDNLPGLIIDYYNGVAVMQMHSVGMFRMRNEITTILQELLGPSLIGVYDKSETTIPFMSGVKAESGFLFGSSGPMVVTENGLKFIIDWTSGQKTGFFIDQRENRQLLEKYTYGRDVLNMFGYTGAFSVYAMKNARTVHTVDSSESAIKLADENIKINFGDDQRHQSFKVDAFEYLNDIKNKYDLIILDPPAFAKHKEAKHQAMKGYQRLNALAGNE